MGNFFLLFNLQRKKKNLEGYIFSEKFLTIKNVLEWTSGFRAINDLPCAHWDETEISRIIIKMTYDTFPGLFLLLKKSD